MYTLTISSAVLKLTWLHSLLPLLSTGRHSIPAATLKLDLMKNSFNVIPSLPSPPFAMVICTFIEGTNKEEGAGEPFLPLHCMAPQITHDAPRDWLSHRRRRSTGCRWGERRRIRKMLCQRFTFGFKLTKLVSNCLCSQSIFRAFTSKASHSHPNRENCVLASHTRKLIFMRFHFLVFYFSPGSSRKWGWWKICLCINLNHKTRGSESEKKGFYGAHIC